jgi:hypothetical protein
MDTSETIIVRATSEYNQLEVEADREIDSLVVSRWKGREFGVCDPNSRANDLGAVLASISARLAEIADCLGLRFDSAEISRLVRP